MPDALGYKKLCRLVLTRKSPKVPLQLLPTTPMSEREGFYPLARDSRLGNWSSIIFSGKTGCAKRENETTGVVIAQR